MSLVLMMVLDYIDCTVYKFIHINVRCINVCSTLMYINVLCIVRYTIIQYIHNMMYTHYIQITFIQLVYTVSNLRNIQVNGRLEIGSAEQT